MAKHAATRFFDGLILGIDEVAAEHGALVLTTTTRTPDGRRPLSARCRPDGSTASSSCRPGATSS